MLQPLIPFVSAFWQPWFCPFSVIWQASRSPSYASVQASPHIDPLWPQLSKQVPKSLWASLTHIWYAAWAWAVQVLYVWVTLKVQEL